MLAKELEPQGHSHCNRLRTGVGHSAPDFFDSLPKSEILIEDGLQRIRMSSTRAPGLDLEEIQNARDCAHLVPSNEYTHLEVPARQPRPGNVGAANISHNAVHHYHLEVGPGGWGCREMDFDTGPVAVSLNCGMEGIDSSFHPWRPVREVEVDKDPTPGCGRESPCKMRYSFLVDERSRDLHSVPCAREQGNEGLGSASPHTFGQRCRRRDGHYRFPGGLEIGLGRTPSLGPSGPQSTCHCDRCRIGRQRPSRHLNQLRVQADTLRAVGRSRRRV